MVEKPKCKLCHEKHWSYEPHVFKDGPKRAPPARPRPKRATNVTPPTIVTPAKKPDAETPTNVTRSRPVDTAPAATVTPGTGAVAQLSSRRRGFGSGAGRPKAYASHAERQAAYRKRRGERQLELPAPGAGDPL